ncbi:hypothetical protein ACSTDW_22475, partial [Vibrio vulnificus]|uniref:hypothetical protein n=1 Tax=Vibrio vulnificus TaxID=672 RepID=UPI003ED9E1F6
ASSLNSGLKVLLVRFVIVPPVVYEVHSNTSNQVAKLTMPLQLCVFPEFIFLNQKVKIRIAENVSSGLLV